MTIQEIELERRRSDGRQRAWTAVFAALIQVGPDHRIADIAKTADAAMEEWDMRFLKPKPSSPETGHGSPERIVE